MYKASHDRITGRIKICLQWEIVTWLSLITDIKSTDIISRNNDFNKKNKRIMYLF